MSDAFRDELEALQQRSELLKQQATDLFDQARALEAKVQQLEQQKQANAADPPTPPQKSPE